MDRFDLFDSLLFSSAFEANKGTKIIKHTFFFLIVCHFWFLFVTSILEKVLFSLRLDETSFLIKNDLKKHRSCFFFCLTRSSSFVFSLLNLRNLCFFFSSSFFSFCSFNSSKFSSNSSVFFSFLVRTTTRLSS